MMSILGNHYVSLIISLYVCIGGSLCHYQYYGGKLWDSKQQRL